jgi:hypothetical protein
MRLLCVKWVRMFLTVRPNTNDIHFRFSRFASPRSPRCISTRLASIVASPLSHTGEHSRYDRRLPTTRLCISSLNGWRREVSIPELLI